MTNPKLALRSEDSKANNLRSRAAQLRLQAIESQLSAAFTFCSVAKTAQALGRIQHGREAIKHASHTAQMVRFHLDEPDHVPADSRPDALGQLAELEEQLSRLDHSSSH
jgi:hypothetical protein